MIKYMEVIMNTIIPVSELIKNDIDKKYESGYRIVYFYDDHYSIGEYCKTIEGFMIGFAKSEPILCEDDIPAFISNDDLLDRYLEEVPLANIVAIYATDGSCVAYKQRENSKIK